MRATDSTGGVLAGGGEMGARIRAFDWSQTALGPMESWSPTLRTTVSFLLANRFPLLLWWGPRYISIYNEAYVPVLGQKHPQALGQPVSECWSEIWYVLQPLIDTPFEGGPSTWMEDLQLEIRRSGFTEETHFTVAYSPVPDETAPRGIGGVLATVHEITEQIIGERRIVVLRDLGVRAVEAKTAEEACTLAAATLAEHPRDIPFGLLYLIDPDRRRARLAGSAGLAPGGPASPRVIELGGATRDGPSWPLAEAVQTEAMQVVADLAGRFGAAVPPGPWSDPPQQAVLMPIRSTIAHQPAGMLVVGVSSRLQFDESYRGFIELAAAQIATAVANARAYEAERQRAEALVELDRAKTAFFSNVSHEFRTPLTLTLGPLEDLLAGARGALPPPQRTELEVAHRNALRLLRLVNTLLDFSRIEAGRVQASYVPTDLPAVTADLASTFRSAVERAGLRLVVACPPLPAGAEVYVDRDMWEKIVLNLLSNALKFTFAGEIAVTLQATADGGAVQLAVRDTGTGIPAAALPRLFERFHRVQGARARTHEGTGIGLALVQELVNLHAGAVSAESVPGVGTSFTVTIPTGAAHLPPERLGAAPGLPSTAVGAAPYVEEALRWLPGPAAAPPAADQAVAATAGAALAPAAAAPPAAGENGAPGRGAPRPIPPRARVLLADDNADMRDYVARLLHPLYEVEAVPDGAAALAAARERLPDLVLSDVMMPGLDGFALLRALRADPRTRDVPVVLLSARAGEESHVEGLDAGADDYLAKPFAARELRARVRTHLELARMRAEATHQEHAARAEAEAAVRSRDEFLATVTHDLKNPLAGIRGHAQLLLRRAARDPARQADVASLSAIEAQTGLMRRLLDQLLDATRLQAGQALPLQTREVDLAALVERIVDEYRPTTDRHDLVVELPAASALVGHWDADRLEQVVANLLSNAIKYSPDGGPVSVRLTPAADETGPWAVLTVQDHGLGIPAADLPNLFDRFHRGSNVVGSIPGMGIGLASTQAAVVRHGGSLAVDSHEGRGTTVTVRLPLRSSA